MTRTRLSAILATLLLASAVLYGIRHHDPRPLPAPQAAVSKMSEPRAPALSAAATRALLVAEREPSLAARFDALERQKRELDSLQARYEALNRDYARSVVAAGGERSAESTKLRLQLDAALDELKRRVTTLGQDSFALSEAYRVAASARLGLATNGGRR